MDKVQDMNNSFNHGLTITERKNLIISGVKKIESFDNEEFLMETTLGFLVIKGSELEIIKLDTYQGNVSIKGRVDSLMYLDENLKKDKDSSLLNKLFKWYFLRKFYRLFILFFMVYSFFLCWKLIIKFYIMENLFIVLWFPFYLLYLYLYYILLFLWKLIMVYCMCIFFWFSLQVICYLLSYIVKLIVKGDKLCYNCVVR